MSGVLARQIVAKGLWGCPASYTPLNSLKFDF